VKLVDTPDLGSGAARCESSSLSVRTIYKALIYFDPVIGALKVMRLLRDYGVKNSQYKVSQIAPCPTPAL
jgi:hypothetical protein